ncbi:MAG: hypothetical protein U1G07_09550 [Verrucomicrobiota bacterium]
MAPRRISPGERGYALMMVLLLCSVATYMVASLMRYTSATSELNRRSNEYSETTAAAEACVERVLGKIQVDYQIDAEGRVIANMDGYRSSVPTSSEDGVWSRFAFTDAQGNSAKTFVKKMSSDINPPYVALQNQFKGLNGFASTYRIVSNVQMNNQRKVTGTAQEDVQLAEIPVFQFAIFYNGLLEFTWAAPLIVRGRVHANGDIYVGSSCDLTFDRQVTCTGKILSPAWGGHTPGQYTGGVYYNGQPPPGFLTGVPAITLPIGLDNSPSAVREILNPPPADESPTSDIGKQRYYNLANLQITVGSSAVQISVKSSAGDSSPSTISFAAASTFLSTNVTFYDQREAKNIRTTQIDMGKFRTWMATNATVAGKCPPASNPIGVVYVNDTRPTTSSYLSGIRLVNADTLPSDGLTIATPNPLYIKGNYNCPNSAHRNTSNTSETAPASIASDALTILSSNWDDSKSSLGFSSRNDAVNTTINAAIITGAVDSTASDDDHFSGGVMNLPRLLEDWGNGKSTKLTLNTSMVKLFYSLKATTQFQSPGIYYYAPIRDFNFDQNFTDPSKLPPATPRMRAMIRATYANPPPGSVTYNAP